MQRRLATIASKQLALRSGWVWYPVASAALVAWTVAGHLPFANTLDDLQLSRGAADFITTHRDRFGHIFNTDNLGGSLIYRFGPDLRVFVDDRTPVYGEAFMADYFRVFDARAGWQDVLARWDVTGAIVATGTAIAPVLKASPQWLVEYEDAQTLVCSRRSAP